MKLADGVTRYRDSLYWRSKTGGILLEKGEVYLPGAEPTDFVLGLLIVGIIKHYAIGDMEAGCQKAASEILHLFDVTRKAKP